MTSIIAGMAVGADSIDDLDVIRAGGTKQVFTGVYASATVGILLREFTHGHVSQLSGVLRRHLLGMVARTPVLAGIGGSGGQAFVDIDSLLRPVYGREGRRLVRHTKIAGKTILRRGLSRLATTISTPVAAPVLAGVRLQAGKAGSSKGAASMVTDAVKTAEAAGALNILVRGDSAFGNSLIVAVAGKAGARFSLTLARNAALDAAISSIGEDAWTPVRYPGAVIDTIRESTGFPVGLHKKHYCVIGFVMLTECKLWTLKVIQQADVSKSSEPRKHDFGSNLVRSRCRRAGEGNVRKTVCSGLGRDMPAWPGRSDNLDMLDTSIL